MISRIRIEAFDANPRILRQDVGNLVLRIQTIVDLEPESDVVLQTTKDGMWGYVWLRRKDAA